jgi:transposase-like protein
MRGAFRWDALTRNHAAALAMNSIPQLDVYTMPIRFLDKSSSPHDLLSMDPRGFPTTLPEFQRVFPDDAACARYLEAARWPEGFTCPKCGWHGEPYRFTTRSSVVLRCRGCKDKGNISLTAGTVMQSTHTPLSTWFWAAYLVTTQTPGESALQFQRQLGLSRYETAFQILHKLRAGMVRPERDSIGAEHPVEVDECYVGGRTRGEGRGVHHQVTVVGAVEVRQRTADGKAHKRDVYAGRLRLRLVSDLPSMQDMMAKPALSGRSAEILTGFVKENVLPGSTVRTDGWIGYDGLGSLGYKHDALALGGDPEKAEAHLPMIHLVFSNLKAWINGTHHGVSRKHLQAYLNEYVFRFNRRFYPMTALNSALGIAAHSVPPTYEQLYSGAWVHPGLVETA